MRMAIVGLLLCSCAGGQTGDIVDVGPCEEIVERTSFDSLREPVQQSMSAAQGRFSITLVWHTPGFEGETSAAELLIERTAEAIDQLGPDGCATTYRARAQLTLSGPDLPRVVMDGVIDATQELDGTLATRVQTAGRIASGSSDGRLPFGDIWIALGVSDGEPSGELSTDEAPVAFF